MTGFININKKQGVTSATEVNRIKRLVKTPCGHMGTLDPMASGVLPVAIGNAARLFDFFLGKTKTYIAEFCFGIDTDTLDSTGKTLSGGGRIPSAEEISSVMPEFIGKIEQIPPKFSAKSVNGRRGYSLAREGKDFELAPKTVKIESFRLLEKVSDNVFSFEIVCGAGTYIRALARDLGARLSTCAVMSSLVRTRSGPFDIKNSVETERLTEEDICKYIIKTEDVLNLESIYTDLSVWKKLGNGMAVATEKPNGLYKIYNCNGEFYGIAEVIDRVLKVKTKLC